MESSKRNFTVSELIGDLGFEGVSEGGFTYLQKVLDKDDYVNSDFLTTDEFKNEHFNEILKVGLEIIVYRGSDKSETSLTLSEIQNLG